MQTPTPNQESITTLEPKKNNAQGWILLIAIILLAGAGYWYWSTTKTASIAKNTTITDTTSTDAVTSQLNSVSSSSDPATIKSELANTNVDDITPELKTITAETKGL